MKLRIPASFLTGTWAYLNFAKQAIAADPFCSHGGDWAIDSGLGCIPTKPEALVTWALPYLFGIAGGLSFLLIVYGFFLMATSSGDAKKMAGAQETITSAISGLLISIFALFILRLVAVDILQIPGLAK
jgi:hypothetical protein